jgi:DNA ligase 1
MNHMLSVSMDKESFILDAEVVAVDADDGSIRSFQELSNRARKVQSNAEIKIAVSVFTFDLMYFNGKASHNEIGTPCPWSSNNMSLGSAFRTVP